jgi:hypothetical protein
VNNNNYDNRDTIDSGQGLSNPDLVKVLTDESAAAYDFLSSFDIDLTTVTKLGGNHHAVQPMKLLCSWALILKDVTLAGHSRARTHRPSAKATGNVGWVITSVRPSRRCHHCLTANHGDSGALRRLFPSICAPFPAIG